jgi:hypothetical protein
MVTAIGNMVERGVRWKHGGYLDFNKCKITRISTNESCLLLPAY